MSTKPASAIPYERLAPSQVIGLFLARLFACLMRLEADGQSIVPADIANMAASVNGLVDSFIRMRASAQLESAGFSDIARAMRVPICSREPAVHIELTQGCRPATPTELLSRLKPVIEQFEQAESLAATLAGIILCVLCVLTPETREAPVYARSETRARRIGFSAPSMTPLGRGPPYQWPPPCPPIPVKTGIHASGSSIASLSKAWTPAFAGVSGR